MSQQPAQITELVHRLIKAMTLHKLYGPDHPMMGEACQRVTGALEVAAAGASELTLGIAKDRLLVGSDTLEAGRDAKIAKFINYFHHLGVSQLRLRQPLPAQELARFLEILSRHAPEGPEAV